MSDELHERVLSAAEADRERRPWRYYKLDVDDLKRGLDKRQDDIDTLRAENARLTEERAEALKVLSPSMPESGLVDACRQVKQVAISEADNSEKLELALQQAQAERDALKQEFARLHDILASVSPALFDAQVLLGRGLRGLVPASEEIDRADMIVKSVLAALEEK